MWRIIIKNIYIKSGLIILFLLFIPHESFSNEFIQISSNQQFKYAEQLFFQKNYSEAVFEYQRFIHFFPNDSRKQKAMFQIGMAYYNNRKYEDAVYAFKLLTEDNFNTKDFPVALVTQAYFMICESYIKQNDRGQAIAVLHNLLMLAKDQDIQDQSFYKLGWIYLESGLWEKAKFFFSKISLENKEKFRLAELSDKLNQANNISLKNPAIAGALSIIPGAGFLYCNRYRDALTAFLFNSGLMLAAYKAFDNENPALGSVISLVELGFYSGNFYGAVTSAHKYNRDSSKKFLDNIKENTKVKLSLDHQDKGIIFSLNYDF
ncbi:tetratricopeptide repeat-containing [Desulfonema limicola]|uniref:Tetratricopeptide repeat-containing n=1 Tax=Desulfonema limicola TaxID=45656 RepID=A0A975B4C7_9BACT|nr:tetratricopeptide repeat-containing [Desulfonema limicola]